MSGWSIPLDKYIAKAQGDLGKVARKIVLTAFRRVILRTPVKTGRARGGWLCTIGTPAIPTEGLAAVNDTDRSGRNAVAGAEEGVGMWDPLTGKAVILTNNVPYIGRLEHGSSTQAPNGMVAVTVAELGGIAQEAAHG